MNQSLRVLNRVVSLEDVVRSDLLMGKVVKDCGSGRKVREMRTGSKAKVKRRRDLMAVGRSYVPIQRLCNTIC